METIEIKGRDFHFVKRIINSQHGNPFPLSIITSGDRSQWSEDFVNNLINRGLLRINDGFIYATDLAINSIKEKEKRESMLIEEQMIEDGFEYAFLSFMDNRNEPVHTFDMPENFPYHSKIHMEKVAGSEGLYKTWEDQISKYIIDPTIDGYVLNHAGKTKLAKLKKEKLFREENEGLDIEIKKQTVAGTRFSINVAFASLFVAGLAAFIPLVTWWMDKDSVQKTSTEIPQLQQVIQNQEQIQQNFQEIRKTVQNLDSSVKKLKNEK